MVSSETLFLFSKACELFIMELAYKSYAYAHNNKRRTIQKYDIKSAVTRTQYFDFILDSTDDKFKNCLKQFFENNVGQTINNDFIDRINNEGESSNNPNVLSFYMNHYKNFFTDKEENK
jgi:hypothetical protein